MMLNAITLESFRTAIVHVDRQRYGHGALWVHEPLAVVFVNAQIIGDDLELVAGHFEHFVVVNVHRAKIES